MINKTLLPILAAFGCLSSLHATVIVDMDLSGKITNFAGDVTPDSTPYSLSSPMLEAADYTNTSNTAPDNNATVYGGYSGASFQFHPAPEGPNGLKSVWATGTGAQDVFSFAAVWVKDDFLNGGDSQVVNIDSTSSITALLGDNGTTQPEFGWVITKDGTTYITDLFTLTNSDVLESTASGDLTGLSWYSVDLATDMHDTGTEIANPTAAGIFNDIDGIGLINRSPDSSTSARRGYIQSFQADVTVIPEPSATLLLGVAAITLLLVRRRKF